MEESEPEADGPRWSKVGRMLKLGTLRTIWQRGALRESQHQLKNRGAVDTPAPGHLMPIILPATERALTILLRTQRTQRN